MEQEINGPGLGLNRVNIDINSDKLTLKDEYLDQMIRCPFTGEMIVVRFLNENLYNYFKLYYPHIFNN